MLNSYNACSLPFIEIANSESKFGSSISSPPESTVIREASTPYLSGKSLRRMKLPRLFDIFLPSIITQPFMPYPEGHLSLGKHAVWLNNANVRWFCIKSFPELLKSYGYQ